MAPKYLIHGITSVVVVSQLPHKNRYIVKGKLPHITSSIH